MKRLALALSAIVVGLVVSSCAVGVRQPATSITATSATLNGKVLSTTGGPGNWYFEYGTTTARTARTPTRLTNFGVNGPEPVSEQVGGLEPGTTYHFAVCAGDSENFDDPFCSPDQTFETEVVDPQTDYVNWHTQSERCAGSRCVTLVATIVASSGPSGENPHGVYSLTSDGSPLFSGEVTCLRVSGNRAVVGLDTDAPEIELASLHVEDGTPDRFTLVAASERLTTCPPFTSGTLPDTSASIIVHDAPAPSS